MGDGEGGKAEGATDWGEINGARVVRAVLRRGALQAAVSTYGARLLELWTPDRNGAAADILLGFDDLASYAASDACFGATCGRYAGRIAGAAFELDGEAYALDRNDGPNHLHGGRDGFDRKLWDLAALSESAALFRTVSADGEMGYPGRLALSVRYALEEGGRLTISMSAETDKPTPINLINHAYFNLAGQGAGRGAGRRAGRGVGTVLDQELRLGAARYLPITPDLTPAGTLAPVAGGPFDFRRRKPIGRDMARLGAEGDAAGGYDHTWALNPPSSLGSPGSPCFPGSSGALAFCAEAYDPASGRRLWLETTEPGVGVYLASHLTERVIGKGGAPLGPFTGFTLETQKFPNSPNVPRFPNCVLRPGETYRHEMRFTFSVD